MLIFKPGHPHEHPVVYLGRGVAALRNAHVVHKLALPVVVAQAQGHDIGAHEVDVVRRVGAELRLVASVGAGGVRALKVEHDVVHGAAAAASERASVVVERNLKTRDKREEEVITKKTRKFRRTKDIKHAVLIIRNARSLKPHQRVLRFTSLQFVC